MEQKTKKSSSLDSGHRGREVSLTHTALRAAVKWLGTWMHDSIHKPEYTDAGFRIRVPAKPYVRRLADGKADPLEILTQVCGFWRYSQRHPDRYDKRHSYVQGLGTAMLHVLPMPTKEGRIPKSARTEAGEEIFANLLPLLVRVNEACSNRVTGRQTITGTHL